VISIELDRDRIRLEGGYTPGLAKTVPGARFEPKKGAQPAHWMIPLSLAACHALRGRFGDQLRVGKALSSWARTAIEEEKRLLALGSASDADLLRVPDVSPVLAKAMASRTYQRVAARFIAEGRNVLIGDQPGLGKTLEALGGIIESGVPGPYLVVAPKTATHAVWKNEIPRWWPGAQAITVPDGRAVRDRILDEFTRAVKAEPGSDLWMAYRPESAFLVVHPEMLRIKRWWVCPRCQKLTQWKAGRKSLDCVTNFEHSQDFSSEQIKVQEDTNFPQLFALEYGAVVMDEADRILLHRNASQTQARIGAECLKVRPGGLRIPMTGTPMHGKPFLLWGYLNWMLPKVYSSKWRWIEMHYEVSNGWGGSRQIGEPKNEKALYHELNRVMLRRTKVEVAPDMPAKTYVGTPLPGAANASDSNVHDRELVGVWLPMDGEQRRLYDQIQGQGHAKMEGGDLNPIGILAELTRLKQFATASGRLGPDDEFVPKMPSNKFDYLMGILDEWGFPEDPTEKVVVVSQFTSVLALFQTALRAKMDKDWIKRRGGSDMVCELTGRVTGQRREDTIARFNQEVGTDSPHVMFLNLKAGGVAITLDTADHMIMLDEDLVPDNMEQVEDRIHRVSRPRPVFYHYLRSLGTVEEHIAATNLELAMTNHEVLDGRRGLEFSRRVAAKL